VVRPLQQRSPTWRRNVSGTIERNRHTTRLRERVRWVAALVSVIIMQGPYRTASAEAPIGSTYWRTDLATALGEARASHRQVLVDFAADWCQPCQTMKRDVWPDPEIGTLVSRSYVPLSIDIDRDKQTPRQYRVSGIPTVMVLDGTGRVVRRTDGYLSRSGMLRFLAPVNGEDVPDGVSTSLE
jgi:thiol:disulfide interchange protein